MFASPLASQTLYEQMKTVKRVPTSTIYKGVFKDIGFLLDNKKSNNQIKLNKINNKNYRTYNKKITTRYGNVRNIRLLENISSNNILILNDDSSLDVFTRINNMVFKTKFK